MPHDTPAVVDALIRLCCDADRDVRDWATFTLGSQFESDSPSLRAALHERLTDAGGARSCSATLPSPSPGSILYAITVSHRAVFRLTGVGDMYKLPYKEEGSG
jgi:HEAT repeat protein